MSYLASKNLSLDKVEEQFRGTKFNQLVEHHINSMSSKARSQAVLGVAEDIGSGFTQFDSMEWIDRWNAKVYNKEFWQTDTSVVFREITDDARVFLRSKNITDFTDDSLFNMFNIIVLNFAYSAEDQPKMREFIGIKRGGILEASLISLLYPILAMGYALKQGAPFSKAFAYGLANLGYLLLLFGIFVKNFKVFHLYGRAKVLIAAIIFWIIGVFLSN